MLPVAKVLLGITAAGVTGIAGAFTIKKLTEKINTPDNKAQEGIEVASGPNQASVSTNSESSTGSDNQQHKK